MPLRGAVHSITEILRAGARRLIAQAVEAEFETFLAASTELLLPDGRQRVVRHGHDPVREIQTGIGPVEVQKPKARDRGATAGARIRFTSNILPKWARRTKSLDALLPVLYLRGISAGDFQEALAALLGKDAPNLSAAVIGRLKSEWEGEYQQWQKRDLSARHYVYVWADGVYLQARMEPQAECMLVLMGATPEGRKELIGFQTGMRESAQSWKELLVDLKARGLSIAPEVAVGDGALGFWKALDEAFPTTRHQRCWLHKTLNVLDKFPKSLTTQRAQGSARDLVVARPGLGGSGDDDLRREIHAQIRQGRRVLDQGSADAADLLRLSGRSLGSSPNIEPDRERLRDGEASHRPNERRVVPGHRAPHGVQTGDGRVKDLAAFERSKPVAESRQRYKVQRRNRRCRRNQIRRLTLTTNPHEPPPVVS